MRIRPLQADDFTATLDLLTSTFGPFYRDYARPHLGERVFGHQHGQWEQDYRDELPALHAPRSGRFAAVSAQSGDVVVGLISWRFPDKPHHGEIHLLAVSPPHRRQHIGRRLCEHAIAHMRAAGVEVVEVSTGGDPFHAPARALYESLGLTQVPIAAYLGAI